MPLLDRDDCLLVVIDAQDGFYGPQRVDVDRALMRARLDTAAWVCALAAALDVPTVVTEEDPATNGPTDPAIASALGTTVRFDKSVFGAADNPPIDAAVERTGRGTIIIVGMDTDICVTHSALGWAARGRRVLVVRDAVYSAGSADEAGLRRLEQEGIVLLSAKQVYYEWLRTLSAVRAFDAAHPRLANPPGFSL
jgi:nicotinamidase-related amidase